MFHFNVTANITSYLYQVEHYVAYTGSVYQDLCTPLATTYDWKMYDWNSKARNTLKSDCHQNRKINVFFLCCKNMVNWRKEIKLRSLRMLVIFSIMKNIL